MVAVTPVKLNKTLHVISGYTSVRVNITPRR